MIGFEPAGVLGVRNMPGKRCVFVIDLPLAEEDAPAHQRAGRAVAR
jgi:hypothetical protein